MRWVSAGGLTLRALLVALVAVLLAVSPYHPWFAVTLVLVGLAQAIVWPAQCGMLLIGTGVVLAWTLGGGLHADPPAAAAIVTAAALYAAHLVTTVAAFVPLDGQLTVAGWTALARRTAPTVLLSAAVIALDYGLDVQRGSPVYETAGVVAVVVLAAALTLRTLSRRV